MAQVRADRRPSPSASVPDSSPAKSPARFRLAPNSSLPSTPSVSSIATTASRTTIAEKAAPDELGEEASPYLIRNLNIGQTLDLRDECHPDFATRFSLILDQHSKLWEMKSYCAERRSLALSLFKACSENDWMKAEKLLKIGANPAARVSHGWTALHVAAEHGWEQTCRVLIRYGADVGSQTLTGLTPLHFSARGQYSALLYNLLQSSAAAIDRKDAFGRTALHYAAANSDKTTTALLLSYGANPAIRDNNNDSPLDICTQDDISTILRNALEVKESVLSPTTPRNESVLLTNASHSDFTCLGLLGKGEYGEVFLVQLKLTSEKYAMKRVRKGRAEEEILRRERNILARIEHPFIAKLQWAFQTSSHLCLVLEYCPCGDLGELLRERRQLSEELSRFYVSEIVLALDYMHSHGIVYRDLKPENLVFDSSGHIHITDFSLAKDCMPFGALNHSFCGPLAYSPPEMVRGDGHGHSADWYMLGCLLYEMLVGVPPFHAVERWKLFMKIERGKVKFPNSISVDARDLILRLLHLDPSKRFGRKGLRDLKWHSFFDGVDWVRVLNKSDPAPFCPPVKVPQRLYRNFGRLTEDCEETRVRGWSFIRTE